MVGATDIPGLLGAKVATFQFGVSDVLNASNSIGVGPNGVCILPTDSSHGGASPLWAAHALRIISSVFPCPSCQSRRTSYLKYGFSPCTNAAWAVRSSNSGISLHMRRNIERYWLKSFPFIFCPCRIWRKMSDQFAAKKVFFKKVVNCSHVSG